MAWKQIEATPTHLSLLVISSFLILYAVFSNFIRNRLHLSEPPFALLVGIIFGPKGFGVLDPVKWGLGDDFTQELTRIAVGIQCFAVGLELPKSFFRKYWKSVAMLLGPVMAFGWLICALFVWWLFKTDVPTALLIAACLTPTDPILAASILANSQFSERVPPRIKRILSAESGCNDGVSFPFIYVGLSIISAATTKDIMIEYFLVTILWQCVFGLLLGLLVGDLAFRMLYFADKHRTIDYASYLMFYLLVAIFCVGLASTLGVDDFLVAFGAGCSFARHNWFVEKTSNSKLPAIVDIQINSSVFIYFAARIPWSSFSSDKYPELSPGRLIGFLALVLAFRRIPIVLALKPLIPGIKTWSEALFCGHFGPMGVAAIFLAIEARAKLETDTSLPLPHPPTDLPGRKQKAVDLVWPIVTFVVMGSTLVHGMSTLAISLTGSASREDGERAPLLGGETDQLAGMVSDDE